MGRKQAAAVSFNSEDIVLCLHYLVYLTNYDHIFLKVAHRLSKGPKISVVYSSDLKRALDTAETIASSCGGLQV